MLSIPPVLLLLFNRPDLTKKLISILRSVRPSQVYIAIDGPRPDNPEELQKVQEVREIARSVDWTKQVHYLVREKNLGCGRAVSSALDWFFEQEEQGIILEDDIHPSLDFFSFCKEMLTRYSDDNRVATILGHSFVPSALRHPAGYFFSKYFQGWGWATWRRFWKTYDFNFTSLTLAEWEKLIIENSEESLERFYWLISLHNIANTKSTWDYQVQFCAWRNKQVNIIPGSNLISNEGFRKDATHSTFSNNLASRKTIPLVGPFHEQPVEADQEIDQRSFMWQYIMNETHLFHLVRYLDPEYQKMKSENLKLKQELVKLNQDLLALKQDNS